MGGHPDEIRDGGGLHLAHDLPAVHLHHDFAGAQFGRDLLVEPAGDDEPHHLPLPRGQPVIALAQRRQRRTPAPGHPVTLQGVLHGVEQVLVAEGLGEELHRPGLHGPHRHRDVAIARDEDNRQVNLGGGQLTLEVQAAQAGQTHVEHQAAGCVRARTGQKLPGGAEGLDAEPDRPEEVGEGMPERGIIIDDKDHGVWLRHNPPSPAWAGSATPGSGSRQGPRQGGVAQRPAAVRRGRRTSRECARSPGQPGTTGPGGQ